MEFKDLKKGDTFEATFEVDGEEQRSWGVRVKGRDGSHWISFQSFQNLKIHPRALAVGDTVTSSMYGSNYRFRILALYENHAWLEDSVGHCTHNCNNVNQLKRASK